MAGVVDPNMDFCRISTSTEPQPFGLSALATASCMSVSLNNRAIEMMNVPIYLLRSLSTAL
jgi:hypothetical protein